MWFDENATILNFHKVENKQEKHQHNEVLI